MKKIYIITIYFFILFLSSCATSAIYECNGKLTVYNSDGTILRVFDDVTWEEEYNYGNNSTRKTADFESGTIEFQTKDFTTMKISNAPWILEYYKKYKVGAPLSVRREK